MSAVIIGAAKGQPYRIGRNGSMICIERDSRTDRRHSIALTSADAIAVCNAVIDIAEQIEQDQQS